jgi:hypothetical protein
MALDWVQEIDRRAVALLIELQVPRIAGAGSSQRCDDDRLLLATGDALGRNDGAPQNAAENEATGQLKSADA